MVECLSGMPDRATNSSSLFHSSPIPMFGTRTRPHSGPSRSLVGRAASGAISSVQAVGFACYARAHGPGVPQASCQARLYLKSASQSCCAFGRASLAVSSVVRAIEALYSCLCGAEALQCVSFSLPSPSRSVFIRRSTGARRTSRWCSS